MQSRSSLTRLCPRNGRGIRSGNETTRIVHSSSPSSRQKRRMTEEQRTAAVKDYLTKHMQKHLGKFPSCSSVIKEVGGGWHQSKEIYNKVVDELRNSNIQNDGSAATKLEKEPNEMFRHGARSEHINSTDQVSFGKAVTNIYVKESISQHKGIDEKQSTKMSAYVAKSDKTVHKDNGNISQDVAVTTPLKTTPSLEASSQSSLDTRSHKSFVNQPPVDTFKDKSSMLLSQTGLQSTEQRSSAIQSPQSSSSLKIQHPVSKRLTHKPSTEVKSFANAPVEFQYYSKEELKDIVANILTDETSSSTSHGTSENDAEIGIDVESLFPSTPSSPAVPRAQKNVLHNQSQKGTPSENLKKTVTAIQSVLDTGNSRGLADLLKQTGQKQRKGSNSLSYNCASQARSDDENDDDADFSAFEYPDPVGGKQPIIPRRTSKAETPELQDEMNKRCIIVKFVRPVATESDISTAFTDCGRITKVSITQPKREGINYKYALVYFNTEEGFQNALMKNNVIICGGDVVAESFSCNSQHFSESLTSNTAVSSEVVKQNLGRRVMIQNFPNGCKLDALKKALSFCGKISNVSMGQCNSTVYIDFETEEAKDKALAAPWISVDGKQLQITAVDPPRTPVVRISNVNPMTPIKTICSICESLGSVKKVKWRDRNIVDVHFKQGDTVYMPNIISSLNGVIVDQSRWQAQSAPVFPPEAVQLLWRSWEGRAYLHRVTQHLIRVISQKYIDKEDITHLSSQCYGFGSFDLLGMEQKSFSTL
eukprot:TRINITY_DN13909_c0_g1_i1.p1 TRINITY_DN13909_c0_g1~~TRINITY_DN13909_c0_g1_i1.p1  ORF type:complete len:762 (-),score=160.27 TRINITY_DN13909_c0_g1_i1:174-2459(-)